MINFRRLTQGKLARFFIVLCLLLVLAAIAYSLWAQDFIDAAFAASVKGAPTVSFIDHTHHDLDYFHKRADLIFWQYIFFGIPLTLIFWVVAVRLIRRVIRSPGLPGAAMLPGLRVRHDTLIAIALYTLLTLVYFAPLLGSFGSQIIGPPEDNMGGYWNLWYSNEMVVRGDESLTFTEMLYYPEGTSMYYFAWSFYNFAVSIVLWLFMSPAAVFNIIILHSYPLAGLGAFLLIRKITGNSLVAIVGGFLYAFSPHHFARSLHHGNLNAIQFMPFFVLYFMNSIREGGRLNLALATVFFFLNSMCDWNYMIIAGYFIFFGYVYLALKRHQWILKDYLVKSSIVVGSTLLVSSPWLWQMMKLGLSTTDVDGGGLNTFVIDFIGLFVPGVHHWGGQGQVIGEINASYTGNAWEAASYLGLAGLVLAIATFPVTRKIAAKWWLGFVAFVVMALGPQIHVLGKSLPVALPYTVIANIPFFSNVRATGRFMVVAYLFWGIIVAISLQSLAGRFRTAGKRFAITAVVAALLLADYFSICRDFTRIEMPAAMAVLQAQGREYGLLNLPRGYQHSMRNMMEQTIHRIPIVDGAATRKIGKTLEDRLAYDDLDRQRQQLSQAMVKYIVIHLPLQSDTPVDVSAYMAHYELVSIDEECVILRVY